MSDRMALHTREPSEALINWSEGEKKRTGVYDFLLSNYHSTLLSRKQNNPYYKEVVRRQALTFTDFSLWENSSPGVFVQNI